MALKHKEHETWGVVPSRVGAHPLGLKLIENFLTSAASRRGGAMIQSAIGRAVLREDGASWRAAMERC
jgi:hypothetical protein